MGLLQSIEKKLWPDHSFIIDSVTKELLSRHRIGHLDVGAADGLDERWQMISEIGRAHV